MVTDPNSSCWLSALISFKHSEYSGVWSGWSFLTMSNRRISSFSPLSPFPLSLLSLSDTHTLLFLSSSHPLPSNVFLSSAVSLSVAPSVHVPALLISVSSSSFYFTFYFSLIVEYQRQSVSTVHSTLHELHDL